MKQELNVGSLLAILIPLFASLTFIIITWGSSIETRLKEHSLRIQNVERTNGKVEVKLDEIRRDLTSILVELQNKSNRK
jgi:hypothetical protein|tara:strand:+ start:792 stop:1028 length:237 start_codon:yes stop_codon:yes gene_type:complete